MNIYIASSKKLLGVVVTDDNNNTYYKKVIISPNQAISLAVQQGILFMVCNKVPHDKTVNVYADEPIELNPEFNRRYGYKIVNKTPQTDIEKQRMLSAQTEIMLETRRFWSDRCID
jgi:hypothetical protein